jgi:16S rRNA (cytidine1402-2'-O)-methyltransferase
MAVYLIPCPIDHEGMANLPQRTLHILHQTTHFVVERAKTARHFIKDSGHPQPISSLMIVEINDQQTDWKKEVTTWLQSGVDIGVISEAGCPGIADPGAEVVALAHQGGQKVVPLVGPSSIFLALMASGFSGQHFSFHGYLPNKKTELVAVLKKLEKDIHHGHTHIFMETPYRNGFMLETLCQSLQPNTLLCVACDLNNAEEDIKTQPVKLWEKNNFEKYHKRPAIFLIGK